MRPRHSKTSLDSAECVEKPAQKAPANSWLPPPDVPDSTSAHAVKSSGFSSAPTAPATFMKDHHTDAQRRFVFSGAALPTLLPPNTITDDATEMLSSDPNGARGGISGVTAPIDPWTTVLVANHITNTGAVVRLERVDYSKAMRAYRVCWQEGGIVGDGPLQSSPTASSSTPTKSLPQSATSSPRGLHSHVASPTGTSGSASPRDSTGYTGGEAVLGHNLAPWRLVLLRLFSAADMMLFAVAVACFLVVVSRLRVMEYPQVDRHSLTAPTSLSWSAVTLTTLASGRAMMRGVAAPSGSPRGSEPPSSSTATSAASTIGGEAGLSASYVQLTRSTTLDTGVTFSLLLLSTLLLVKRLSGALNRVYVEEVLVMRGVGLQFSAYGIFNTLRYRHFVDLLMLRSLVIHDAFFRYQPIFFLSSSVENKATRVVFFPDTLPRLAVLRPVLNGIRSVLYGEPDEGMSLAELESQRRKTGGDLSDGSPLTDDSFAEDTATTPNDACFSDATDHDEY
ncbi:hypothetical protein JKF63_02790 [Porcisia hertigi]|uniref:Phosphatidylinositol N-acetylglucosaminyltransferase subunit H conserved domain-containing protein n=1 Tax=Porcisia hertigi TaxID=2761500 RepID=A0A836HVW7_9TRYP|nr:hypothetical protein JKF63_02790 [Porcisia hertigi]